MKSFGRISISKIYDGTNSVSVGITANSQIFISYDRGETFTPEIIKLTPNCQGGSNFKSWQYSTDNGATWKDLGNNTHGCTIDSSTHILSINHSSDIFGVGNMASIRANIIENKDIFDVFSIAKIYDGSAMTDGYNSEVVYLYKRATSVPSIDWNENLNYNFTINALTSIPSGWSATIPDGSSPLYVTSASAFSREIVDDISPSEWTTPVLYKDTRSITEIVNKYKVSSLSEGVTTSDSGWSDDIPEMTIENRYLWSYKIITYDKAPTQEITDPEVVGVYGGSGSSVTYQVGDFGTEKPEGEWLRSIPELPDGKYLWTKIIMQQSDGTFTEAYSVSYKGSSGSNGLSSATIYLYRRSKSVPAVPSTNVTYNFSNHTATGSDIGTNKWRQTIPDGTDPIYITTATALSTEDTDIIEPSEWASPTVLSKNGTSVSINKTSVTYQVGISGTTKPTNDAGWTTTIPDIEAGKYLWTKTVVEYSDGTITESYGVSYRSLDGTKGTDGRGVSNTSVSYQVSDSGTTKPTTWKSEIPEVGEGKYLWTKTVITYTDGKSSEIYSVSRNASNGTDGKGISKVTEYYLASDKSTGITVKDNNWDINIPTISKTKRFLWNYEKTVYTDDTEISTDPCVIGVYGESGVGIKNITEEYAISNSSASTPAESEWKQEIQTMTSEKRYLWNRETITYTDETTHTTDAKVIGVYGDDGKNGAGVIKVDNKYLASDKATGVTIDGYSWKDEVQTLDSTNKYLWNYEITILSDNSTFTTDPCVIGTYSTDGIGIDHIDEQYAVTNSSVTQPTDSQWKDTVQSMTSTNRYLWNRERIYYTNDLNNPSISDPRVIGVYGETGQAGKGISQIITHYIATDASSGVTKDTTGWKETVQKTDSTNKYLWSYQTIKYTDNTEDNTTPCIIGTYGEKGDSIKITSQSILYASSSSGTEHPTNGWQSEIPELSSGEYLWTKTTVTYSDGTEVESYSVAYNGINAKEGYESAVVYLYKRATSTPTIDWTDTLYYDFATKKLNKIPNGWSDTAPSGTNTLYVTTASAFAKTITDDIEYTEWTTPMSYNNTRTNTKIENFYLASNLSSGVTISTSGWSTEIPNITNEKKYLWMYSVYTYNIAPITETTDPSIITIYGGNDSSVSYQVGDSGTEKPTGTWSDTIPEVPDGKYLWTKIDMLMSSGQLNESYSVSYKGIDGNNGLNTATVYLYKRSSSVPNKPTSTINYNFKTRTLTGNDISSEGWSVTIPSGSEPIYIINATAASTNETDVIESTEWSTPQILSQNGAEGKGYTILLSNEAHTFVYANPSATTLTDGQSTSTSIKAWRNTSVVNATLSKIGDTAVSGNATITVSNISFTISGNGTNNVIVTIKPTTNAPLTGSIKFTITIDGLSFEKNFTYSATCPGTKGDPGSAGKDSYAAKLVTSSQIFKSTDGGITFTPNTITVTPIYQNCSHSKWQFSIDGGTTWKDISDNSIFTIDNSTHILTISSSSTVFTKTVTAVSLKCVSDKDNIYDVITIARIYDVNDLVIGGRNFLSLITGSIGYCLRDYNPIKGSDGSIDASQCLNISVDSEDGWITLFGKNNNTSDNINIFYIVNRDDIELRGSTYTLSVEWKSSTKYPLFISTNGDSAIVNAFTLKTTEKKITFSVDENTSVTYVGIQIPAGTVIDEDDKLVFRCQLEQGTVATDWKLDPIDQNNKYIQSSSEIESLSHAYYNFQAIFDKNQLNAESNINDTIKNLNDAINGTESTEGILTRLNEIINDPDNVLKNSTHLFEFSTWKTSKDGLEALIGKINENESAVNELKVKNDGLTSTVTDLTTKGVLACMDFDADHGLTIQTPKKIGQEGGDSQARIVIDGDSVEGFSGNNERQFLIGNSGVECKSLAVSGEVTFKNGLILNYIKIKDYIMPTADANGHKYNGLDFVKVQ